MNRKIITFTKNEPMNLVENIQNSLLIQTTYQTSTANQLDPPSAPEQTETISP